MIDYLKKMLYTSDKLECNKKRQRQHEEADKKYEEALALSTSASKRAEQLNRSLTEKSAQVLGEFVHGLQRDNKRH